jgi:TPR repeat protein
MGMKNMKVAVLLFLALLLLPAAAGAGQIETIRNPYANDDSQPSLSTLQSLAAHGDTTAAFKIGWMYWNGIGVREDTAEAIRWYRKAAEQGDEGAQFSLGVIYWWGMGNVPRDYAESARWYRMAADQGDTTAQLSMSKIYEHGAGVQRDMVQAYMWCALAQAGKPKNTSHLLDELAAKMKPEDIAQAKRLVAAWRPSRGSHGR